MTTQVAARRWKLPDPTVARVGAPRTLRPALIASYFGTAVEFYDFFIYATAAALVFPTVFFPHLGPTMASVASLGAFAAAFLARPVGAIVFGHIGDRVGRKKALTITLLIMGVSTVGVGLLPGAATIGVAAPLILIALRLLQGFAVGGEWAGAALLCAENSPQHMRGRSAIALQLGIGSALVSVNLIFLLAHSLFGDSNAAFLAWGWRIPFLLSSVLIAVGIYVRLHLTESAEFDEVPAGRNRLPISDLFRRETSQLLLTAGAGVGAVMLVYQAGTFLNSYAATHLHFSKPTIFAVSAVGGVFLMAGVVLSGFLSDIYGRRRLALVGYSLAVPWSFVILPLLQTGDRNVFAVTVVITYTLAGIAMTPLTAFIPAVFATRNRYTGTALSNNISAIIGGALPPVISPLLMSHGIGAVSLMMGGFTFLSLVSVLLLREEHDGMHLVPGEG